MCYNTLMKGFSQLNRWTALLLAVFLLCPFALGCGSVSLGGTPIRTPAPPKATEPAVAALAPKASPLPVLTFVEDAAAPLPVENERLTGTEPALGGTVVSTAPLSRVVLSFSCDYNEDPFYPYVVSVNFQEEPAVLSYSLFDGKTLEGISLDQAADFSLLQNGYHTMTLTAYVHGLSRPFVLRTIHFYMLAGDWKQLTKRDFSSAYRQTLDFFHGDKTRFLYRYQQGYDRYLVADPDWEDAFILAFDAGFSRKWRIHRDALPYYEKAVGYLHKVRLRVHGTCGDTGVLPLSSLVDTYNGSYVSRFITGTAKVSHHAFGTATDLNAAMAPNLNNSQNRALIQQEVGELLSYNGILSQNGVSYYDFTYSGQYALSDAGVPQTIVNYLLYELAFYRAGFLWGHYYRTKSDAMHFTLTDDTYYSHDGKGGLRKVFFYGEP